MLGISVIIPTFRDDAELSGLLSTLVDQSFDEIIVVDGEARHQPAAFRELTKSMNVTWVTAPRGRGSQIATGIHASTQPLIWILHADSRPSLNCASEIRRLLTNSKTSLACFPLAFRTRKVALSLFSLLSHIDTAFTTFGDQGYAMRRVDYDQLDLRLSDYPLLEDVALRKALKDVGRVKKSRIALSTSARRFDRLGIFSTQVRNLLILLSYWLGTSPATLYAGYYTATPRTALKPLLSSLGRRVSTQARVAAQKTASD